MRNEHKGNMRNEHQAAQSRRAAGFPSPAQGYEEKSLDLNTLLIDNPPATFFMRSASGGMAAYGIFPGTLLVVDRSIRPKNGSLAVIIYEDEFLCREFRTRRGRSYFTDGQAEIDGADGIKVFGTVKAAINDFSH
jgi:DNA polymerase V